MLKEIKLLLKVFANVVCVGIAIALFVIGSGICFNPVTNWLMLIPGVFCILVSITLIVYQTIRFTINW